MIIKTCLVHCLFRSHPQRQPKRSPFLQGSGSTGEAFPVAGWGMSQFSRNLGRPPTWDPWDPWDPWDAWDGSHSSATIELIWPMGSHHFWPTIFSKWDHESRTCVFVTMCSSPDPQLLIHMIHWFTKELKQNCPNPWWCCAGANAQKVPQAWQRFQPH